MPIEILLLILKLIITISPYSIYYYLIILDLK